MPLIADAQAISEHTGSTLQGPVQGTVDIQNQDFVFVENNLIMSDGDEMVIPSHWYANTPPPTLPLFHSHRYPATPEQVFVFIEDKLINMVDDAYAPDYTFIKSAGNNNFVFIEEGIIPPPPTELWPVPFNFPPYWQEWVLH